MSMYQGVIFDFNGVLVLDGHWQEMAWMSTIAELTGQPADLDTIRKLVHGCTNRDIFQTLLGRALSDAELETMAEVKESCYRQLCLDVGEEFRLSPGAETLLARLQETGTPFTIATASGVSNMRFFFERLDLRRWFTWDILVYDDGSMPGMLAPDVYLKAQKS